ncbi:MAG: hypothetical protein CMO80_07200 [Verrucomicrobiales bacterium]|nr:hypothetical protein [Verrucomicrobiales bacterium]|tara:strand:- start:14295 stop:15983 length:1689 start_codon:yes stop_codon:yes gene_type:complete
MKQFLICSSLILMAIIGHAARPNVVFILSDNQSFWEFGCHGNKVVRTPHVDRLAKESVDFRHFYATPYCSPSRAEFLTGRYAMHYGIYNTIGGVSLLPESATTLAEVFRDNGYRTGIFGKWHLGDAFPMRPEDQGFQEAFWHGGGGVGQLPDFYGNTLFDTTFIENDKPVKTKGFCTDRIFDRAIRFIEDHQDEPFFCYVPTPVTHKPWHAPDEYKSPYEAMGMKSSDAAGYGQMTNLDENVGRLLQELDRMKLRENTVVIFATDQGMGREAPLKNMSLPQVRGGHRAYDWANHVAFMIRFPKRIKHVGYVQQGLTSAVDLFPTLAEWCELKHEAKIAFDGVSVARYLENPRLSWPANRNVITQCPRGRTPKKWTNAVVRRGPWRLTGPSELFNVENDWRQQVNVASRHPALVGELSATYEKWWSEFDSNRPAVARFRLGDSRRSEVRLNSMDWYKDGQAWNQGNIRRGRGKGTWAIDVVKAGLYRVELRRFPREADEAAKGVLAELSVAGIKQSQPIEESATHATFVVKLPEGQHDLEGAFKDEAGKQIGSFFAYVRLLRQ